MTDALAAGIDALHIDLGRAAQDTLHAYVALLEKWNRTHNLTAIRDPAHMITHHLLDSLAGEMLRRDETAAATQGAAHG